MEDFSTIGQDNVVQEQGPGPLAELVRLLTDTKPWLRFFSVLGFIGAAFMALSGLFFAVTGGASGYSGSAAVGVIMGLVYVALGLLYFFPSLHLSRAASAIKDLEINSNPQSIAMPLMHQFRYWRFIGILTIVVLVLAVLGIILAIGIGVSLMNRY